MVWAEARRSAESQSSQDPIAARKSGRFHPGLGTELLGFLARIVGLSIGLWLNPVR